MKKEIECAVQSEAFLLRPHTVTDLDDFVANPDRYLVSMFKEPERAAALWRERLKKNPYGSEGFLSLTYYGHDLIPADLWDEVSGIWYALIELVEEFIQKGSAERLFPDQPVPLRLQVKGRTTLFSVNSQTSVVDPKDFIPGLLDEAVRYYSWIEQHLGTDESEAVRRIHSIRSAFQSGLPPN